MLSLGVFCCVKTPNESMECFQPNLAVPNWLLTSSLYCSLTIKRGNAESEIFKAAIYAE